MFKTGDRVVCKVTPACDVVGVVLETRAEFVKVSHGTWWPVWYMDEQLTAAPLEN